MPVSRIILCVIPLLLLACAEPGRQAEPETSVETGILHAKPGFTGDVLGAQVLSVSTDETLQVQIIHIRVPIEPAKVDRLQVISAQGKPVSEDRTAQILRDYDNNAVGVTVYVAKQSNWAFKLKLIDDESAE